MTNAQINNIIPAYFENVKHGVATGQVCNALVLTVCIELELEADGASSSPIEFLIP
jgi:hypothetical protein